MNKKEILILLVGVVIAVMAGGLTWWLQVAEKAESETPNADRAQEQEFDQMAKPRRGDLVAQIETTLGTVKMKLFPKLVPKVVENFKILADRKYFDGLIFHRVIQDFMIQTGDPTGTGRGGESAWGGKFDDQFSEKLSHLRGAVSMANAGPNTNGSQFFIVQKQGGTSWLDPFVNGEQKDCTKGSCHAVFAQVFEGLDVVDKIGNSETGPGDRPKEEIKMESVRVFKFEG